MTATFDPQAPTLTPNQRRTQNARRAFIEKFDTPEAKREHFQELARRSNASRALPIEEVAALQEAYSLLGRVLSHPTIADTESD